MKCKKCNKDINVSHKFCSNCGNLIELEYSPEIFLKIYENFNQPYKTHNDNPSLSKYFKKHLDNNTYIGNFGFFIRSLQIQGYNIRLTFSKFKKILNFELPEKAEKIYKSNKSKEEKIKDIVDYFDTQSKTVGPDKALFEKYVSIDWEEYIRVFTILTSDLMEILIKKLNLSNNKIQDFQEMVFVNASYGHTYRLIEEIFEGKESKNN